MTGSLDDVIRASSVFRRLGPEDRKLVAAIAHVKSFSRGEFIFREGEPSDAFYTITGGRVKIFKLLPGGKEVILEIFGQGDPLGAIAAYEGRPFPASALTLEDTTCLILPRGPFFALLEQQPSFVRGLLVGMTQRMVELTNRLAELSGGRIEARLARLFLKLADSSGRPHPAGVFIAFPLSRQELADLTGTTIETCIRIMSRWGRDNILRTEKDGFLLMDRGAVEQLAEN